MALAVSEPEFLSRKGYAVKDLARSFMTVLGETGPIASGKLLHYTADLVCSGGLDLWMTLCWDHAFEHIGIASPRIFVYLKKKFTEILERHAALPFATFTTSPTVQQATIEVVLVLQGCPKRLRTKLPSVPEETHTNETWFLSTARSSEKAAARIAWNRSHDLDPLLTAGNEMMTAVQDGALEKALFWLKWLQEEDAILKKRHGSGLSTMERGPAFLSSKQRTSVSYYVCVVLAEAYKDLAAKGLMRMHEEFQALLDLYRSNDKHLNATRRQDALILMIQLLTEVPRWKVPAAPSLVRDTIVLGRAVAQSEIFYKDILMLPLPAKPLPSRVTSFAKKKIVVTTKLESLEHQLNAVDEAIMSFYGH
jgi:hypothetical protein